MKVLVVAPHPDDEVLGCGGVIARHTAEGNEVHVLVVSRGVPEIFPPKKIERTRTELREAHKILGVSGVTFLDFPAPRLDLVPGYELADGIARVIGTLQPIQLYLPHHGDLHADHRAVYLAGLVAARPIKDCSVKKVFCYETMSETEWSPPCGDTSFIPTVFTDITDYLEVKIRALSCLRSQMKSLPHSRSLGMIEALARLRGCTVGLSAAEAFSVVREIN